MSGQVILAGVYRGIVSTLLRKFQCPLCSAAKTTDDCYLTALPEAVHEDVLGRRIEVVGSICGVTWLAKNTKSVHKYRKMWQKSPYLDNHKVYFARSVTIPVKLKLPRKKRFKII